MSTKKDRHNVSSLNGLQTSKPLFSEDEKVLCYEPDQKKAQVLYDSKVLEVVEKKDSHGKLHYEYKIHFQGWKSSWDRHVREVNVLKDTEANRNLQRDLNEQAQLLNKTAIKKKKRKTILEKLKGTSLSSRDSVSSGASTAARPEPTCNQSSGTEKETTDQEDSSEEEDIPAATYEIYIPRELKILLEEDAIYMRKKMLIKLPLRWSVADILEEYIFQEARNALKAYFERREKTSLEKREKATSYVPSQLCGITSMTSGKTSVSTNSLAPSSTLSSTAEIVNETYEDLLKTFQKINTTKRIVDDLRILFDFTLSHILLYGHESEQYKEFCRGSFDHKFMEMCDSSSASENVHLPVNNKQISVPDLQQLENGEDVKPFIACEDIILHTQISKEEKKKDGLDSVIEDYSAIPNPRILDTPIPEPPQKRRRVMTSISDDGSESSAAFSNIPLPSSVKGVRNVCELGNKCENPWICEQLNTFMDELMVFQIVPRELVEPGTSPSLCYGIIHLLRLLVKTPEILSNQIMTSSKNLKTVVSQINKIAMFVEGIYKKVITAEDWYTPKSTIYEEDYFGKIPDNQPTNYPKTTSTLLLENQRRDESSKSVTLKKGLRSITPPSIISQTLNVNPPSTRRRTLITEASSSPQVKVEEGKSSERTVTRNQRRGTAGRITEAAIIDGNTLGTRKSLTLEELSRETLVAASIPDSKSYSLRVNCRAPYYR